MKKYYIFIFLIIAFCSGSLYSKEQVSMKCTNSGSDCKYEPKIWLIDLYNTGSYSFCIFQTCKGEIVTHILMDNASNLLNKNMTAKLISGMVENNDYMFYIFNPQTNSNVCRLYYDNSIPSAVLEDFTSDPDGETYTDDADEYFHTQQFGGLLLITKKIDIDLLSVYLCNIDGRIITYLPNVSGWLQFSFDLSGQPSGMYLLRFIASARALTKKVIYFR